MNKNLRKSLRWTIQSGKKRKSDDLIKSRPFSPGYNKNQDYQLLKELKEWRNEKSRKLELDSEIIWPMSSILKLSRQRNINQSGNEVREWQKREFSSEIAKIIK